MWDFLFLSFANMRVIGQKPITETLVHSPYIYVSIQILKKLTQLCLCFFKVTESIANRISLYTTSILLSSNLRKYKRVFFSFYIIFHEKNFIISS